MLKRRALLKSPIALALSSPLFTLAADPFPSRPVRFIVPGSPGTGGDVIARYMGRALEKMWGATIVVENRAGAGGVIGTDSIAKAAPDGYNVLVTTANHYALPWIMDKIPYNAATDFAPVSVFGASTLVAVVGPASPYSSVVDVVAAARAHPGTLSYSSAGNGTLSNMSGALMNSMAKINVNHVPYKSASQGLLDVSSGSVTMGFLGMAGALPLIKGGRLKAVAVTSAGRSGHLPEIPSMAEQGFPGFDISSELFALVPAGTPTAIVQKLASSFTEAAATPAFKEFCVSQGLELDVKDTAAFAAAIPQEFDKWKKLVALTQRTA